MGVWRAFVLAEPIAAAAEQAARDAGFLVNAPAADVLRLAPPLVITEKALDAFVRALPAVLDAARVGSI
jgi:acetylornithine aminotransferase